MTTTTETFRVGGLAVVQTNSYGRFSYKTHTIERETKLYWVVAGAKYRKADGYQPGENVWIGQSKTLITLAERNRRRSASH